MLMLLGTGPWQRSLFDMLQETNQQICTISPDNTGFGAAYHIEADVRDVEKIITEINKYQLKPSYFLSSQTDLTVKSVAYLNNHYGFGINQISVANTFTNKVQMRERVARICKNLQNPFYEGTTLESLVDDVIDNFICSMDSFVIKPASLQSSLGVKIISKNEDFNLTEYIQTIAEYGCSELIMEGFVDGIEYTIEGYKYKDGTHEILAVSRKEKKFGFGIANALHFSPEAYQDCVDVQHDLEKLFQDYCFGPTHTEVIKTADGALYLVEAAIRGGGSGIPSYIVPEITGFYPEQQMLVDSGLKVTYEKQSKKHNFVLLIFYEFKGAVATQINTENVKKSVISLWSDYKLGETVRPILDDRSRHGFFIIASNTKVEQDSVLKMLSEDNPGIRLHV